jgi:hypothetical protein
VVGITITGAAAWGSFIAKERFENQPLGLRAATGITVGTELALAGVIGVVLVTTPLSFPDSLFESKNSAYAVTRNGEIVRETLQGPRVISVSGVDGQSIDSPVGPNEDGAAVASARLSEPRDRGYNDTEHFFINITGSKQSNVLWLYVARLGLIADYDTASRQLLGWFGPDGFSAGETPPQTRFSGTPLFRARLYEINRSFLLPFPNSVYRMNVDGSIELVFTPEAGERVTGASVRGICFRCTDFDLIATTRRVAVVAPNGSVEFSAPRDPRATGYPEVRVFRPPQAVATTVVWYSPAIEITDPTTPQRAHELVTRYGPNEAHYDLPVLVTSSPASWSRVFVPWFVTPVTMPVGMVLSRAPISWRAVDRSLPTQWFGVDEYGGTSSMNHETYSNGQRVVVWGLSALNSFLSALLAARIGRAWALAKRRRLFWTIASFLLGSLGLMVMLCLFERPVTEQCPACKRMRVVTRENCEHCGERFPAPARDGTEIFESLSAY